MVAAWFDCAARDAVDWKIGTIATLAARLAAPSVAVAGTSSGRDFEPRKSGVIVKRAHVQETLTTSSAAMT